MVEHVDREIMLENAHSKSFLDHNNVKYVESAIFVIESFVNVF